MSDPPLAGPDSAERRLSDMYQTLLNQSQSECVNLKIRVLELENAIQRHLKSGGPPCAGADLACVLAGKDVLVDLGDFQYLHPYSGGRESGGQAGAGKLSDGSSAAANSAAPFPEDMPTSMRGTRYEQPMCPVHGWAYTRKRGDSWFCFLTQTGEVTERVSESHWRVVRRPGAKA